MQAQDAFEKFKGSPVVSIDFETTGKSLIPYEATVTDVAIGWIEDEKEEVIKSAHFSFVQGKPQYITWDTFELLLYPIWENPEKTIVFHNAKYDLQIILRRSFGVMPLAKIEDTMIMAFLTDENQSKSLKDLSRVWLNKPRKTFAQVENKLKMLRREGLERVKAFIELGWDYYKINIAKPMELFKPSKPSSYFEGIIWEFPDKLKKKEFSERLSAIIAPKVMAKIEVQCDKIFSAYAKEDASDTLKLFFLLKKQLTTIPCSQKWYYNCELPFALLQIFVEIAGVRIDEKKLKILQREVANLIEEEVNFSKSFAEERGLLKFNPGSNAQVKVLLWGKCALQPPEWAKMGKGGQYPTARPVMQYLLKQLPEENIHRRVVVALERIGALKNLLGTFLTPIEEKMCGDTLRTSFNPVGAPTGRLSSNSPNLQNITSNDKMPVRSIPLKGMPEGWNKKNENTMQLMPLRSVFIPRDNCVFVVADYSQIELRLVAYFTQDPSLLEAYTRWDCICGEKGKTNISLHCCPKCGIATGERDKTNPDQPVKFGFCLGLDLHSLTALKMGLFEKYEDKKMARQYAKTINFGLCYCESPHTLHVNLGISIEEAEQLHAAYFRSYPFVKKWHKEIEESLCKDGFFMMALGNRYRRFFQQVEQAKTDKDFQSLVREAVNSLPQGSAADIVKLAELKFWKEKENYPELRDAKIILQVHDEIVVECRKDVSELCAKVLRDSMENAVALGIPFLAEVKVCPNSWAEGK